MSKTSICHSKLQCSDVLYLHLPNKKHVRIEVYVKNVCLRAWIRVLDMDGTTWMHIHHSKVKQVVMLPKVEQSELSWAWEEMVSTRYAECLERLRYYRYNGMEDFYAQCRECELYINNLAMMDLQRWSERLPQTALA